MEGKASSSRLRLRPRRSGTGGVTGTMQGSGEVVRDVQPQQQMTTRRQVFADVARRRASHFANFNEDEDDEEDDDEEDDDNDDDDDDDDDDDAIHTGGDQARGLGMWRYVSIFLYDPKFIETERTKYENHVNEGGASSRSP